MGLPRSGEGFCALFSAEHPSLRPCAPGQPPSLLQLGRKTSSEPPALSCVRPIETRIFVSGLTSGAVLLLCGEEVPSFFRSSDSWVIEGLNAYYFSVAFPSYQSKVSGLGFVVFLCCCDYAGCSISL